MKKRILYLLLAVCMLISLMPMTVSADAAVPGVTVTKDPNSRTGYTTTWALKDDGYESVVLRGAFLFIPVITEELDFDYSYESVATEDGNAILVPESFNGIAKNGTFAQVELGVDMSDEVNYIKVDTIEYETRDKGITVPTVSAADWSKTYVYKGVKTTLDHAARGTEDYAMTLKDGMWTVSLELPSGAYSYQYVVTKGGASSTIYDPENQELWYGRKTPTAEEVSKLTGIPVEKVDSFYTQAYATMTHNSVASYAYVPFDAAKQVYNWDFLAPVSDKQYEGTYLMDVEYSTPNNVYTAPEVAEAHAKGLTEDTGLVDFIRKDETGLLAIYLPKDFDVNREEPYKTLYVSHGARGCQGIDMATVRIADNAMANGMDDFIVVSFNAYTSTSSLAWPSWNAYKVLTNIVENIFPFMEENYNASDDTADRALMGFSGGGGVSGYGMLFYSDYFDYFGVWGSGETTTLPGDVNVYIPWVTSYDQFKDAGLNDKVISVGCGAYDVGRAGGYKFDGTAGAVRSIRYEKGYKLYMALRDIIGVEDLHWTQGNGEHDGTTSQWQYNVFVTQLMWTKEGSNGYYAGYTDVDEDEWYGTRKEGVIRSVAALDLMVGDGDGKFRPADSIKLSEAIKIASIIKAGGRDGFDQSKGANWYDTYVNYAIKQDIIEDGDFADYNAYANRAEMAYIFANAMPDDDYNVSKLTPPDVAETDDYAEQIYKLYAAGVLKGNDAKGTFTPEREITRAEAAAIVTRICD